MLEKIVSGGQTGVDRGALDAALAASFPCGGWCPLGRKAEDGAIPQRYPLNEMSVPGYRTRTRQNVLDSDGTLIVFFGAPSGGTLETLRIAEEAGKPFLTLDASIKPIEIAAVEAAAFVEQHAIATLNVAGPRQSTHAGGAEYAQALVSKLLQMTRSG
jgi:Circularly permutated YpsA SLOG family